MLCKNSQLLMKRCRKPAIKAVAFLIVLYVLADVTVLQSVHGSENIGIPARHNLLYDDGCRAGEFRLDSNQTTNPSVSDPDNHQDSNEDCSDEGGCLASCSCIVVSYFRFTSSLFATTAIMANVSHIEESAPKSDPADIFHPPKTA